MLEELLRGSLDHCVKCTICETACPVSNVTPLFAGPKYTGPQAERYRVRRRALGRDVGRLLLGLRDLHAGLPAGREDRRDQRPGAQQAQAPEGRAAARPHHHAPDVARARGHAGGEDRQLDDRLAPAAGPRREAAEGPPRRAGARVRRAGASRAGRASTRARAPAARSSTSTAAAPSTTSRRRARSSSPSSSTTASRSRSPSRTAAGCRCSPAACSTTRARSCCAWRANLAPHVQRRGHDHRRQRRRAAR